MLAGAPLAVPARPNFEVKRAVHTIFLGTVDAGQVLGSPSCAGKSVTPAARPRTAIAVSAAVVTCRGVIAYMYVEGLGIYVFI